MVYPLAKSDVFWTLQGEGALQGEPMVFVRLAGCSVGCKGCDTDYRPHHELSTDALVARIQAVVPKSFASPWVWITGGEPTDHDLGPLIDCLHTITYRVALATSGVRAIPQAQMAQIQWLSVSPHSRECVQRHGHELKIVPGLNGFTWADVTEEIVHWRSFPWRYIQPLAGTSVKPYTDFVLNNPGWRLTNQSHKVWHLL